MNASAHFHADTRRRGENGHHRLMILIWKKRTLRSIGRDFLAQWKGKGLEHFSHGAASSRHVGSITKMLEVSEKPNVFPLHFNAVRMRRLNYFLHFFQSQKMNEWWEFSPFRGTHFSFRLSFFLEVTWRFVLRRFDADRKVNSISAMISAVTSR